jgi:hypothetical protein
MGGEHIVEHENIAFLPGEADRLFSVSISYLFENGRL